MNKYLSILFGLLLKKEYMKNTLYMFENNSAQVKYYHKSRPLTRKVIHSGNLKLSFTSLHKNCPPRARNPLTPTKCDKHRGENQSNYKNGLSLI